MKAPGSVAQSMEEWTERVTRISRVVFPLNQSEEGRHLELLQLRVDTKKTWLHAFVWSMRRGALFSKVQEHVEGITGGRCGRRSVCRGGQQGA